MKQFDVVKKEQWDLLKVKEDIIFYRKWNGSKKDIVFDLDVNPKLCRMPIRFLAVAKKASYFNIVQGVGECYWG